MYILDVTWLVVVSNSHDRHTDDSFPFSIPFQETSFKETKEKLKGTMEQEHKMLCNLLLTQNGSNSIRLHALVSIFLCFVILFLHPNSVDGTLGAYRPVEFISEADDSQFANFAVDERSGDIYIGAKNSLFHLHSDFSLQEEVSTAPDPADCQNPQTCMNYNRILAVAPSPIEKLITCGSFSRRCQYRDLVNISNSVEYERIVINAKTRGSGSSP